MTVQNVIVKNIASGNGSTRQWPFTFACPVEHPEYVKVYIKDADGNVNLTDDYIVDMDTKKVTYPVTGSVLASGEKIVIARELPLHQLLNLVNQGPFFAEDLEVTYDEIVMMIQQLNEKLGRVLSVSVDVDAANDINLTVPLDAGYGWRVSDDGKSIVALSNPEGVYNDTVRVYNAAVADTTAIKNATETLKDTTEGYKTAAAASALAAQGYMQTASTKADTAVSYANEAGRASQIASKAAEKVEVYDDTKTYHLGDVVCSASGNTYRCIATSTGEAPSASNKWVMTATVLYQTFETDSLGDLMVRYPPSVSSNWEIDDQGDIMPYSSSVLVNAEEVEF